VNQSRPTRHIVTKVQVAVAFASDLHRVKDLLQAAAVSSPRVDPDRRPVVQITRFADSAVDFEVMFWARDYAEQGLARSEVYEAVHDGLASAGIELALPTRRVITTRPEPDGPPSGPVEG
jgi:small-conductance mechanosensitive channel